MRGCDLEEGSEEECECCWGNLEKDMAIGGLHRVSPATMITGYSSASFRLAGVQSGSGLGLQTWTWTGPY